MFRGPAFVRIVQGVFLWLFFFLLEGYAESTDAHFVTDLE